MICIRPRCRSRSAGDAAIRQMRGTASIGQGCIGHPSARWVSPADLVRNALPVNGIGKCGAQDWVSERAKSVAGFGGRVILRVKKLSTRAVVEGWRHPFMRFAVSRRRKPVKMLNAEIGSSRTV